jgi:hypothetical protein
MYILTRAELLFTLCYEIPCNAKNYLIFAFHQFETYQLSKTMTVIPRLFNEDFALTLFASDPKQKFLPTDCRSVLDLVNDRTFGSAELLLCGSAQMTEHFSAEHRFFFAYTGSFVLICPTLKTSEAN